MTTAFLVGPIVASLLGLLVLFGACSTETFWRWAGRLKRRLRQDLTRRYGPEAADDILGPPLPYEFFE